MKFSTQFRKAGLASALAIAAVAGSGAAEISVPQGVQATMAVRILEYDRALRGWSGGQLVVGVVAKRATSSAEFSQAVGGRDAQGVPIRVANHGWRDAESLRAWIERSGVRLLYVAEDLGADSGAALSVASARKLPSIVASRQQFGAGATIGLVVRDGKPHILVNLPGSRSAGMDLDPKLLQLSEVVR